MLFFIPKANPDYDDKMHLVQEWLVEFDESGNPGREIGLSEIGRPILAGPDSRNYGFWLDTNMTIDDFEGIEVSQECFARNWCEAPHRGEVI